MPIIVAIFAFIVAAVLAVAQYVAIGFIAYWNITDILAVGFNWWNGFWLILAAGWLLRASTTKGN